MTWQDGNTRWDDHGDRHCHRCGNKLTFRDSIILYVCRPCSEHAHCDCDQMDKPPVVYVLWRGIRLGFESIERAETYIRNQKAAFDPRWYCGPTWEEPVIEVAELAEITK